ncbi:DUF4411 family protein [Bifidobacterium sp. ESL0790]|uniref:DUF4411 family protein n=1 Tax=Bifidobacterium sp. ESL0790 TaxID=2983233 RepID=UPI0023FA2924|nr:DUF4411 family protein [Bifidobacterium sp. ESL0790]WEV71915.1 DUF4411 family protein [Bifidobacterium sp. ESL0790]
MMAPQFLLDSNIFIESHRLHHPFGYAEFHPFWKWLERLNKAKRIIMLDSVYAELTKRDSRKHLDELGEWVEATFTPPLSHHSDEIGALYVQIQDYLQDCQLYTPESYAQWEPLDKADPWLIAAAMAENAIIVTNERAVHPTLNQKLRREPKIPDVAEHFHVKTMTLREFFDANGFLNAKPYPLQPSF